MVRDTKYFLICSVVLFLILLNFSFVLAEPSFSVIPRYINRTYVTQINFTINNTGASNVSNIQIVLPMESSFLAGSNSSSLVFNFSNTTTGLGKALLNWSSTSINSFGNMTNGTFSFNVSMRRITPLAFFRLFNETTFNLSGFIQNTSTYEVQVNYEFEGYVKNETGQQEPNVNLTIYKFI